MVEPAAAARPQLGRLEDLEFDNEQLRELPIDPDTTNVPRLVRDAAFSLVDPTPLDAPVVVAVADEVLAALGLDPEEVCVRVCVCV